MQSLDKEDKLISSLGIKSGDLLIAKEKNFISRSEFEQVKLFISSNGLSENNQYIKEIVVKI